jgi:sugar-phosphatase
VTWWDIGYPAGLLTTAALLPPLIRNWRFRSAAEISWGYLGTFGLGVILWLFYGVVRDDAPLIATNAVTFALVVSLVYIKTTTAPREPGRFVGPSAARVACETRPIIRASGFLFDLDGVLVDSTASVEKHWREIATQIGLDEQQLLERVHGRRSIDVIRELADGTDLDADQLYRDLIERDLSDQDDIIALPGARCTLERLPRCGWTVVTSGTRDVAAARLRAARLPLPAVMVTAEDVPAGKPDPAPYRMGAAALGLAAAQCVVVEDSPPGVESARAAGCLTVALLTTHSEQDLVTADIAGPDLAAFTLEIVT